MKVKELTNSKDLRTGKPVWTCYSKNNIFFEELVKDVKTDIVTIGAGISGAMIAEELSAKGFSVIVIDKRGAIKGSTAASTALLQYEIDQPLIKLSKKIGIEKAERAWRRSRLGVDSLAAKIQALNIPCNFSRKNALYLSGNILNAHELENELEERQRAGLYAVYLNRKLLLENYGIKRSGAIKSFDNISANPCKLTAFLLTKLLERGGKIYSPAEATEIDDSSGGVRILTKDGPIIKARYVVFATGYEIPKYIKSRTHKITSTWIIATKSQKAKLWPEECFIWEAADPYLYIRTTSDGRVICGGEDEEFSDEKKRDAKISAKANILERKLKKLFPKLDTKADYAWAGSFGTSTTSLPSIGHVPNLHNCFAMIGFGGNGITYSRIGAEIITSLIIGKNDPDSDLFKFHQ